MSWKLIAAIGREGACVSDGVRIITHVHVRTSFMWVCTGSRVCMPACIHVGKHSFFPLCVTMATSASAARAVVGEGSTWQTATYFNDPYNHGFHLLCKPQHRLLDAPRTRRVPRARGCLRPSLRSPRSTKETKPTCVDETRGETEGRLFSPLCAKKVNKKSKKIDAQIRTQKHNKHESFEQTEQRKISSDEVMF